MLSRVADNLYWLARYLERAEHTARLLDVNMDDMLDQAFQASNMRWQLLLNSLNLSNAEPFASNSDLSAELILRSLTVDSHNPNSIVSLIAIARENARQAREQISSEMWLQLNRLYQRVKNISIEDIWESSPHSFLQNVVKEGVQMFQGVTDATMNHAEGWHFIRMGRCVERALATAALLKSHFLANSTQVNASLYEQDMAWTSLLKSCTSFEAYCKVYTAEMLPEQIAEFLFLNTTSPRSVRFAADCILDSAKTVAELTGRQKRDNVTRLAGRLSSGLGYSTVDEIMEMGLEAFCDDVRAQCAKIHEAVFGRYIHPQEIIIS